MGGAPRVTVVIGKMFAQSTKVKKPVDAAQQMIGWNVVFQIKVVKKAVLAAWLMAHHGNTLDIPIYVFIIS